MTRILCLFALVANTAVAQMPAEAPPRGWFGIVLEAATEAEQAAIGVQRPVPRVVRVFPRSPAETSGVKIGDYVLSFNGQEVQNVRGLVTRVGQLAPGTEVPVVLHRADEHADGGASISIRVVLDLRLEMRERFRQEWLGQAMPSLELEGVRASDGTLHLGGDASTRSVQVIDYFATWCGPCRSVMPELEALQAQYREAGLHVFGVSGEEMEPVRSFLNDNPLAYRVGVDTNGDFRRKLWVSVLPTIWVTDRTGVIRHIFFGAGHTAELEAAVRRELGLTSPPRDSESTGKRARKTGLKRTGDPGPAESNPPPATDEPERPSDSESDEPAEDSRVPVQPTAPVEPSEKEE